MKNIFENAYFGKPYKTRDGKKALYHGSKKHKSGDGKVWTYHYLMMEPVTKNFNGEDMIINHYDAYINDNGIGRFANLKYYKDSGANAEYDIILEWQEEINEKELNKLAENAELERVQIAKQCASLGQCYGFDYKDGFKDGYKKAKEE